MAGFNPLLSARCQQLQPRSGTWRHALREAGSVWPVRAPLLGDPVVYKAMSMAIDRPLLVEIGYGQAGKVTCNRACSGCVNSLAELRHAGHRRCNAMLDAAGYMDTDGDGVRETPDGGMSILYQTSTNAVRQDFQALIKEWWSQIGIETELRNLSASVFFGGDVLPDTFQKFYADVQMYANTFNGTDPQAYSQRLHDRTASGQPVAG